MPRTLEELIMILNLHLSLLGRLLFRFRRAYESSSFTNTTAYDHELEQSTPGATSCTSRSKGQGRLIGSQISGIMPLDR